MQITRGAEYAYLGVLYIAKQPKNKVVLVSEVAKAWNISESFLAKIFHTLARKGILQSSRGVRGGFILAKPPEKISLLDVIEAYDGPIVLNKCTVNPEVCARSHLCPMQQVLFKAQNKMLDILKKVNFRTLSKNTSQKIFNIDKTVTRIRTRRNYALTATGRLRRGKARPQVAYYYVQKSKNQI